MNYQNIYYHHVEVVQQGAVSSLNMYRDKHTWLVLLIACS